MIPPTGVGSHSAVDPILWELWIAQFAATREAFVVDSRHTITSEPLTRDICARAEKLGNSISGYLATRWEDGSWRTTMGAIDVDTDLDDAQAIRDFLTAHGVRTLLALSRRGAHLWVWTSGDGTHESERYMPVLAVRVRKALQQAVDLTITDREARAHIEVFPKRGSASPYSVGALRMPLFRHPKTGIVYPVVDEAGHETTSRIVAYNWTIPLDTPYDALYALTPPKGVSTTVYAKELVYEAPEPRSVALRRPLPDGPGCCALLLRLGVPNPQPGRTVRCPFHEERHASLSILADDLRVICKAPACPAHNDGRGIGSLALAKLVNGR